MPLAYVAARPVPCYRKEIHKEAAASRYYGIHGLRGFLALAVKFHHAALTQILCTTGQGQTGGVKASANLYSLVETCKTDGLDAHCYLTELFKALPYARSADDYEALLPWRLRQRRTGNVA